jgi:hypothetical protein
MNDVRKRPKRQAAPEEGKLPRRSRGRQTPKAAARYWAAVDQFAEVIKEIASGLELVRGKVRIELIRMVHFSIANGKTDD